MLTAVCQRAVLHQAEACAVAEAALVAGADHAADFAIAHQIELRVAGACATGHLRFVEAAASDRAIGAGADATVRDTSVALGWLADAGLIRADSTVERTRKR